MNTIERIKFFIDYFNNKNNIFYEYKNNGFNCNKIKYSSTILEFVNFCHEINLIDFKYKKVVETTNFVNLMQEIQKFLQEKARKLEEKGLLPKPTPPMFYENDKMMIITFFYEKILWKQQKILFLLRI